MERILEIGIDLICGSMFLIAAMFLATMGAVTLSFGSVAMAFAFGLSLFKSPAAFILAVGVAGFAIIVLGVLT